MSCVGTMCTPDSAVTLQSTVLFLVQAVMYTAGELPLRIQSCHAQALWCMHRPIRSHEVQRPCCEAGFVLQQTHTVTDMVRQACLTALVS